METEKDILKKLMQEKILEQKSSDLFTNPYFPEPSKEQILEAEKLELQTRLVQISKLQKDDLWQEIARQKEIEKRRSAFKRMEFEKQLNSDVISKFWLSNRSCNPKLK